MKNEKLYYRSVDILLDAYNAGELKHGNCTACAVGNLVRANGATPSEYWLEEIIVHVRNRAFRPPTNRGGMDQIKATGYSPRELSNIEAAFEGAISRDWAHNTQYHGLCAVLDVLKEIHEVEDHSHETSKERLNTIYKKLQEA